MSSARTLVPGSPEAFAGALRAAREENGLPAHARVVAWGVPGAPAQLDLAHLPEIGPLVSAGFVIDAIVSPAQAMARLVNARKIDTTGSAVAVLSLNTHGAAIAIVSNGEPISARSFGWLLGRPFAHGRSELLERYLLVSQVAPQLQHVIDFVRPVYGVAIASVLVCGNLPNLRSLTMPLIEEMDIEIETLDSLDLLESADVAPADAVPSLQLAAAVALPSQVVRAAPEPVAATGTHAPANPRGPSLLLAIAIAGAWSVLQLGGSSPAAPFLRDASVLAAAPSTAAPSTPAPVAPPPVPPPAAPPVAGLRPEATMGRNRESEPAPPPAEPVARARPAAPRPAEPSPAAAPPPVDPLPRVDGIMISGIRRVAIVDGEVVSPGDRVGARIVARIDREGVVLVDPAGREVRVAIRMRR